MHTMNSRGYQKNSRAVPFLDPGSHRTPSDNNYDTNRNYNTSREFHNGIFKAELTKKKKDDLALEIEEVPDYSASKARTSSKRSMFARESRDEYFRGSQIESEVGEEQLQTFKSEIYQRVTEMMKDQGTRYDKTLQQLVLQINAALKKSDEGQVSLRRDNLQLQEQLHKLTSSFNISAKENQQKMETLLNQVASLGGTKKKVYGDYGVQLKNSFQGLNSSFSVNLANDSNNSKLVNQVIYQLDSLKKEIADNKQQIDDIALKLATAPTVSGNQNNKNQLPKEEMIVLIDRKIKEEKKNWKVDEKLQAVESKLESLHEVLRKHQDDIFRINQEMTSTFNNQINPKVKKMETSIVDIYSKIDPLVLDARLTDLTINQIQSRLKGTHLLRVRSCTANQSTRIGAITGMNEERLGWRQTYLIDQENYLLDSQGRYLIEESGGQRKRVKVQEGQLYLLGLKGIEVSTCS